MPAKGFQTCRRCGVKKPLGDFPTKGRDCDSCIAEGPTRHQSNRMPEDPFRHGVDVKALDRFLRRPLP